MASGRWKRPRGSFFSAIQLRTVTDVTALHLGLAQYLGMQNRETNLQELSSAYSQFLNQTTQATLQELESALQLSTIFAIKRTR